MLVHDKVVSMNVLCHNPEFHKSRIDKSPAIEKYFNEYLMKLKLFMAQKQVLENHGIFMLLT